MSISSIFMASILHLCRFWPVCNLEEQLQLYWLAKEWDGFAIVMSQNRSYSTWLWWLELALEFLFSVPSCN